MEIFLSSLLGVTFQVSLRFAVRKNLFESGGMLYASNVVLLILFVLVVVDFLLIWILKMLALDVQILVIFRRLLLPFYFIQLAVHIQENVKYFFWRSR